MIILYAKRFGADCTSGVSGVNALQLATDIYLAFILRQDKPGDLEFHCITAVLTLISYR